MWNFDYESVIHVMPTAKRFGEGGFLGRLVHHGIANENLVQLKVERNWKLVKITDHVARGLYGSMEWQFV